MSWCSSKARESFEWISHHASAIVPWIRPGAGPGKQRTFQARPHGGHVVGHERHDVAKLGVDLVAQLGITRRTNRSKCRFSRATSNYGRYGQQSIAG